MAVHKMLRTFNEITGEIEETRIETTKGPTGMYERFTDRARKVMQLANQEAQRFNHECIYPEHLLIAMVKEGCCNACLALIGTSRGKEQHPSLENMRLASEKILHSGPRMVTMGRLPLSPKVRQILESACVPREENPKPPYVCTEHLLLAMLRDRDLETCALLRALNINPKDVEDRLLTMMSKEEDTQEIPVREEKGPMEHKTYTINMEVDCSLLDQQQMRLNCLEMAMAAGNTCGWTDKELIKAAESFRLYIEQGKTE